MSALDAYLREHAQTLLNTNHSYWTDQELGRYTQLSKLMHAAGKDASKLDNSIDSVTLELRNLKRIAEDGKFLLAREGFMEGATADDGI